MAEDEDNMCYMLSKLEEVYQKWGRTINIQETEYVFAVNLNKGFLLAGWIVRGFDSHKYLRVIFTKYESSNGIYK